MRLFLILSQINRVPEASCFHICCMVTMKIDRAKLKKSTSEVVSSNVLLPSLIVWRWRFVECLFWSRKYEHFMNVVWGGGGFQPTDCQLLIEQLKLCNRDELAAKLKQIKTWTCGKVSQILPIWIILTSRQAAWVSLRVELCLLHFTLSVLVMLPGEKEALDIFHHLLGNVCCEASRCLCKFSGRPAFLPILTRSVNFSTGPMSWTFLTPSWKIPARRMPLASGFSPVTCPARPASRSYCWLPCTSQPSW